MGLTKDAVREKLVGVRQDYLKDLAALPHEALDVSPGGMARAPYDFTYEVVVFNDRLVTVLSGEKPGPWPFESWAVAPSDFRSAEKAGAEIERSMNAVLAVWDALDESEHHREIQFASGGTGTPLGMVLMCVQHMGYHDAQLNYVQALRGDLEIHW